MFRDDSLLGVSQVSKQIMLMSGCNSNICLNKDSRDILPIHVFIFSDFGKKRVQVRY